MPRRNWSQLVRSSCAPSPAEAPLASARLEQAATAQTSTAIQTRCIDSSSWVPAGARILSGFELAPHRIGERVHPAHRPDHHPQFLDPALVVVEEVIEPLELLLPHPRAED